MTIEGLIHKATRGASGVAGAWRVEVGGGYANEKLVAELWHYGTRMLVWNVNSPDDSEVLDWDTGWGSVSDQNGMNIAFRVLGLPYRYNRAGGAEVTRLHELSDEQMADVRPTVEPEGATV